MNPNPEPDWSCLPACLPACRAVNPNPEPDWSSAHRGLCLYVSRLLQPVWEMRLVAPAKSDPLLLTCRLSLQTMQVCVGGDFHTHHILRYNAHPTSYYSMVPFTPHLILWYHAHPHHIVRYHAQHTTIAVPCPPPWAPTHALTL